MGLLLGCDRIIETVLQRSESVGPLLMPKEKRMRIQIGGCQFGEISQGVPHFPPCSDVQRLASDACPCLHTCVCQSCKLKRELCKEKNKLSNPLLQTTHSYRLKGSHFDHFTGHILGQQRRPSATPSTPVSCAPDRMAFHGCHVYVCL